MSAHNDWNDWSGLNIAVLHASGGVHVYRTIDDVLMSEARLSTNGSTGVFVRLIQIVARVRANLSRYQSAVVKKRVTDYCSTSMRARLIESSPYLYSFARR